MRRNGTVVEGGQVTQGTNAGSEDRGGLTFTSDKTSYNKGKAV